MALKPWERMEGEGAKAFEAFRVYRDMGAERSLRVVGERLGKSKAIIERWSSSHHWVERVRAYDNDLERAAYQEAVKGVREMQKRHIGMAAQLQCKGMLALQSMNPASMKPGELIKFILDGAKLEREARNAIVGDYEKTHGNGTPKQGEPKNPSVTANTVDKDGYNDVLIFIPEKMTEQDCQVEDDDADSEGNSEDRQPENR